MALVLKPDPDAARKPSVLLTDYALPGWAVTFFQATVIAAATFWAYSPAFRGEFLWDDLTYITQNPLLREPGAILRVWFRPGGYYEYYPIEQTLQVTEWKMWHTDPLGYHLVNVALHVVNALLVWRLLSKFGLGLAWLGGLIFAVHPMNVESVAWISEFKNCCSTVPFLCAACAWIDYEAGRGPRSYWLSLGLFLVAILCKISVTPFPLVILVYAWWKRGRVGWHDLRASLPFWILSLVAIAVASALAGAFTLPIPMIHAKLGMLPPPLGGFASKVALVGLAAVFYFGKFFCPTGTTPMYPQWPVNPPTLVEFLPWPVAIAVVCWLWRVRNGWGRHALLGLLFCFIFLFPVLGFVRMMQMSFTWVFDNFFYVPMIGLIGLVVAGLSDIDRRMAAAARPLLTGSVAAAIVLMAFLSHAYASAYTSAESLWSYAVGLNPAASVGHDYLGKALLGEGRPDEAIGHFETALQYRPDLTDARGGLGNALIALGRVQEGINQYRVALAHDPNFPEIQNNLGIALAQTGKTAEAFEHFQQAIRCDPRDAEAYNNMGKTHELLGELPEAMRAFVAAIEINPELPEAHNNLGTILSKQGQPAAALEQFAMAVSLSPRYVDARMNLGAALAGLGRLDEAAAQFEIILQIDPNNQTARDDLAQVTQGRPK